MTNEQIILSNRVFLMEEGVLNGTGETFIFEDENGRREIEVPEEIHTFNVWKSLGYAVRKGEHSVARFPIWQKSKGKPEGETEEEEKKNKDRYYMKTAFFFTRKQVEEIESK